MAAARLTPAPALPNVDALATAGTKWLDNNDVYQILKDPTKYGAPDRYDV